MSTIIDIIKYWTEDYLNRLEVLDRPAYANEIDKNFAAAYIGVRRSGKTYLAINEARNIKNKDKKNILYINFEDPYFLNNNKLEILDELLENYAEYYSKEAEVLVLDELQNIKSWEKWLRKQIDSKRYQIIITGSSAKLLKSELSTSLTGRTLEQKVYPLSFKEFLEFRQIKKPNSDNEYLAELNNYFKTGGFPAVVLEPKITKRKEILAQYLDDIIYKDIVSRNEIRQVQSLNMVIQYYLSNISSHHSFNKIKNAFNIQIETAQDYAAFCEDAFLLFFLKKFEHNLKVQARSPQKVYCIDTGIRNIRSLTEDLGKIAENIVFIELKRRNKEIYYHKNKHEADFLVVENLKVTEIIQVSYSNLEEQATRDRELAGALEAMQDYNLSSSLVLTKNLRDIQRIQGKKIIFKPLYEFLLEI